MSLNRRAGLALSSILLLVLSACTSIPTTGSVQQGSAVIEGDSGGIEFLPAGPMDGATQDQILRGFIEAASSPASDYAIAREFLTPEFATKWNSNAGVQVDSGIRRFTTDDSALGTFIYTPVAAVDSQGNYTQDPNAPQSTQNYGFEKVDGQWRISDAPGGVIIDNFTFTQTYAPFPLYFFDSTNTVLVPDVRYFPSGASASTRIMKALLEGPSEWLGSTGAVYSAFPPGTALIADSVPVTRGVATVDLNTSALSAGEAGLRRMQQQASASLQSVDNVSSVELAIDGAVQQQVASVSADIVLPKPVESRPLVLGADSFGYLTGNQIEKLTLLSPLVTQSSPSHISLGTGQRIAAMLTSEGVELVRTPSSRKLLDSRNNLIAPALDSYNFVWSVPSDKPDQLRALSTDGTAYDIQVPWTEATRIVALSISRDGERIVAIIQNSSGFELVATAITRGDKRVPVALGPMKSLGNISGGAVDVAWVDSTTVATLAHQSDGTSDVNVIIVGGSSQLLEPINSTNTLSLSGANTKLQIRVLTSEGVLLSLRGGTTWQESGSDIKALAVIQ